MYIDDFQKNIIRKLNREGETAIFNSISDELVKNQIALFYYHQDLKPTFNRSFKAETKVIPSTFVCEYPLIAHSSEKIDAILPSESQTNSTFGNMENCDNEANEDEDNPNTSNNQIKAKIYLKKISFLNQLQINIQRITWLYNELVRANLILTVDRDIQDGHISGIDLSNEKNTKEIRIIDSSFEQNQTMFKSFERFFRTHLILLPGLKQFEQNLFYTDEEVAKRKDRRHLTFQTWILFIGILVSAVLTLLTSPSLNENSDKIIALTRKIDLLAEEIDKFHMPAVIEIKNPENAPIVLNQVEKLNQFDE